MAKRQRNRFRAGALILLYHRVTRLSTDPQLLCVTPQHFSEQIEVLKKRVRPLSLQALVGASRQRQIPRRAVVVTFDDGYGDNLWNAKAVLEDYDVPATVFAATGYVGGKREFWWDEVEKIFLQPGKLPRRLVLDVEGQSKEWDLGTGSDYSEEQARHFCSWNVTRTETPCERQDVYRDLCDLLRPLPGKMREELLDRIHAWAGKESTPRETHRPLNEEEVVAIERDGLIEVGAHTANHTCLSKISVMDQWHEIAEGKKRLERVLGHVVKSFSYPYGTVNDYSEASVDAVKRAGFSCACSNFPGLIRGGESLFELPRCIVRDWPGDVFERMLWNWFNE